MVIVKGKGYRVKDLARKGEVMSKAIFGLLLAFGLGMFYLLYLFVCAAQAAIH